MKRRVAFPFLTLGAEALEAGSWQFSLNESAPATCEDHIPNWDYASSLRVHRSVRIDLQAASEALAIPKECLKLELVVGIATGPGAIPRVIERLIFCLSGDSDGRAEIEHLLSSESLSRRIRLVTEIVLGSTPKKHGALSPALCGSRLWKDEADFRLEGQEPRFPMESISFSERFRGRVESGSLWHLHWSPGDLERDFRGGVRLYLNADQKEFIARVHAGDRATLQALVSGVVSQICERTLSDKDSDDVVIAGPQGSVAWHVRSWLNEAFPGMPLDLIRSTLEQRPGQFHAAIQGLSDVVGEQT